jgi:tripartite-type tricarboxylate transporter receptor subunit TctC
MVTIVVGLPPGGGADAYARLVQRHYPRYIPGRPAIVVQNLPGAGSLQSVMYLTANAPTDGTVIGTFSSALLNEALISPQRIRVDFRNYRWIGNVSEDVRVCYVRSATGIQKWQDMVASVLVVFGATAPGTAGNVDTAMLRNLFGIKLRQVQGYAGSADKRIAIERGEIDGDCGGFTSVPEDWLREGRIKIVIRLSPTLVPGMDRDIPWGGDLVRNADERQIYDFLVAPERLGRLFMVAGRVPSERTAALRTAFDAMVADPEFRADAEKMKLLVTPMTGAVVARHVEELYATPVSVVAKAKAITGD